MEIELLEGYVNTERELYIYKFGFKECGINASTFIIKSYKPLDINHLETIEFDTFIKIFKDNFYNIR
jgi:hypothetical protein